MTTNNLPIPPLVREGQVWRDTVVPHCAFRDAVVLEVVEHTGKVEMARPYCFVHQGEPLVGFERFAMTISYLVENHILLSDSPWLVETPEK